MESRLSRSIAYIEGDLLVNCQIPGHFACFTHPFRMSGSLRILDCHKEDVNIYQFLVNPREHPEVFEDAA